MSFFKNFKSRSGEAFFLSLDIGTDNVKAMVCEGMGAKGKVLGYAKKDQKLGEMQNGSVTDIAGVIRNCHQAIREAERIAGVKTKKMILGISGELVKGATCTTSYFRRDSNNKIDLAELKNIVHKVQWRAFEVIRGQIARESGYSEIDLKLVNAAIVDTRIDGYKVSNPIGFQGKEVSISIFNAFAPQIHYGVLQTIAAEIDREILAIASEPYALASSLTDEEAARSSAIFIDVGAGTTDLAVVTKGVVNGTKMFTMGGRTFTKRLSQSLNISFKEAEEIKLAYSNDKLERQSSRIVRESMKSDCDVWLSGIVLTLEEFVDLSELPSKILLSGGASLLPEITEALETRDWVKSLPFSKKPQVSFLNPKMINSLSDENKLIHDQSDIVPLALSNLALKFMVDDALPAKVLKKVVRLMQI